MHIFIPDLITICTAYHPQSNGVVERANGTIARRLRALLLDSETKNWLSLIPIVQHVINSTEHSTTGFSPFNILFSHTSALTQIGATALINATQQEGHTDVHTAIKTFHSDVLAIHEQARARIKAYERVNESAQPTEKIDWAREELVLLRYPSRAPKLLPPLRGPLIMLGGGKSPNAFRIRDLVTKAEIVVHQDRLVRFHRGEISLEALERIAAYEQDEQQVDYIVSHRVRRGKIELLVHWTGLEVSENSYIPYNAYYDQLAALDVYLAEHPSYELQFAAYKRKFRGKGSRLIVKDIPSLLAGYEVWHREVFNVRRPRTFLHAWTPESVELLEAAWRPTEAYPTFSWMWDALTPDVIAQGSDPKPKSTPWGDVVRLRHRAIIDLLQDDLCGSPSIPLAGLSADSWRAAKRSFRKFQVYYPEAKISLFLNDDLYNALELQFDADLDTLTDEEVGHLIERLIAPRDLLSLKERLDKIVCAVDATHKKSRIVLVRDYIHRFNEVFNLHTVLQRDDDNDSDSESDSSSDSDYEEAAITMRIFTDNLRPKPFKEVMKFKKAERKPTAMDDLQRLALRVAKRDDN
ncbi:Chromo (CHRromatin Organization MOdifier) domain [Carpediemonas membranifera]|uniref:Chromo (CHRromatin Organization MOdifier) domain n=1 Tax=Carpediemonas membranifera TaxID=201153 RepID=A0A8J6AYW9_9EUKA|nr:Chromo (CHRromatin Organization MOdifier) domain [Carpediemonas membranifera]|eukprot:KAG9391818.1 Chromo (CHRromatin Organization MOdifier) domain [Carpediemonas membranifera]